VYGKT